jgi:polar amino acid transport system substrate-binding protein
VNFPPHTGPILFARGRLAIACLLSGLLGAASVDAAECVKTVRWNPDKTTTQHPDTVEPSFNHDMVLEALRRMGCTARFVGMPWARALIQLENGQLDILPGAFETEERKAYAYFSQPVFRSPNVLFLTAAAAAKSHFTQPQDMLRSDLRLGLQISVSYGLEFDRLKAQPQVTAQLVPVSSRESAWRMMELGRLDGLIADETVGLTEVRDLGLIGKIVRTSVLVSNEATRVAFSKKAVDVAFVRAFDQAFSAMLADGSYKAIRERYAPCPVAVEKLGCR